MKKAVILFNLGGPDSLEAVKPFLYNLFQDPHMASFGAFQRIFALLLSTFRYKVAQGFYQQIGGKSPLLENTRRQAKALKERLGAEYEIFISMRYWHPLSSRVINDVIKYSPDEVILLPLYPQYSTTTTLSSMENWKLRSLEKGLNVPHKMICCYPEERGFINATVENLNKALNSFVGEKVRVLFTAHGLPQKIIDEGDPYVGQVNRTAQSILKQLNRPGFEAVVCYQSRVGFLPWAQPYLKDEISRAGQDGTPIIICPISFVSDHLETLYELDIKYKNLAESVGVPKYYRISVVGESKSFIDGLAELIKSLNKKGANIYTPNDKCPLEDCKCIRRIWKG